jgi:hypothetical protein
MFNASVDCLANTCFENGTLASDGTTSCGADYCWPNGTYSNGTACPANEDNNNLINDNGCSTDNTYANGTNCICPNANGTFNATVACLAATCFANGTKATDVTQACSSDYCWPNATFSN